MYQGYTLILDIDGTLCPIKKPEENYLDLVPYPEMVEKIRSCKAEGAKIMLFSSRNMKTYQGNLGLINKYTAPVLVEWLKKWDIPYDELLLGKPWPGQAGFYVDDRAVRPREFLEFSPRELEQLCENDRLEEEK